MERIDFSEQSKKPWNSFLYTFFLRCTTTRPHDSFGEMLRNCPAPTTFDVELKINGVEVSFVEAVTTLEKDLSGMVVREAKDLIDRKMSGLEYFVSRAKENMMHQILEWIPDADFPDEYENKDED